MGAPRRREGRTKPTCPALLADGSGGDAGGDAGVGTGVGTGGGAGCLMMPVWVPIVVTSRIKQQHPTNTRQRWRQHLHFASNLRRQRLGESAHRKSYQTFREHT